MNRSTMYNSKIPIIFIMNNLYAMGGAERNLLNLLRQGESQCFDSLVLTSQQEKKLEPFDILKTLYIGDHFSIFSAMIWIIVSTFIVLIRYLCRCFPSRSKYWNPVLIHGYMTLPSGMLAVLIGKLLRIKSVVSVQGQDLYFYENSFLKPFQNFLLHNTNQIIVQTNWQKTYLLRYLRKNHPPIGKLHNGIEMGLTELANKSESITTNKQIKLLYIGRLIPAKQPLLLIEVFDQLTKDSELLDYEISLTIIGDGPLRNTLLEMVHEKSLTDKIHYIKHVSYNNLRQRYSKHDALLVTSFSEGLPNVILEAMTSGCPVISTHFPGIDEIITNNVTGIISPSHKPSDIISSLKYLIFNPLETAKIRRNAYNYVKQNHSFKQIIEQQYRIYRQIISFSNESNSN